MGPPVSPVRRSPKQATGGFGGGATPKSAFGAPSPVSPLVSPGGTPLTTDAAQKGIGGAWACPECTLVNTAADAKCMVCDFPRPSGGGGGGGKRPQPRSGSDRNANSGGGGGGGGFKRVGKPAGKAMGGGASGGGGGFKRVPKPSPAAPPTNVPGLPPMTFGKAMTGGGAGAAAGAKPPKWACSVCTLENEPFATKCEACGAPKGAKDPSAAPAAAAEVEAAAKRATVSPSPKKTATPAFGSGKSVRLSACLSFCL